MGQMFSYVVGILVAGVVVFGLGMGIRMSSPAYARQINAQLAEGKTLDELEQMLSHKYMNKKIAAITAIGQGDDDIDRRVELIGRAMGKTSDVTTLSIGSLSIQRIGDRAKPGIQKLLDSGDPEIVRSACGCIRALGTKGDEYSEAMLDLLKRGGLQDQHVAIYAMQKMSPERLEGSIDLIIDQLGAKNFNTQCTTCRLLQHMGPHAEPAVERLVKLAQEGIVSARSRACLALAAIGPVEGYDIPALIAERLGAYSFEEKVRALDAMGILGPDATKYLGEVERLMNDPLKNCMPHAALAYYRISGDEGPSLKKLLALLHDSQNRTAAIECLGGMGVGGTDAVPHLVVYLDDHDMAVVETTVLALKQIGPTAGEALPKLKKMLAHDDFLVATAAKEAVDAISEKSTE